MDANKLEVLRSIGYEIRDTCGTCVHATFSPVSAWSTCGLHSYEHQKHSHAVRQLSIHQDGWCPSFVADSHVQRWAGFAEFRKERDPKRANKDHDLKWQ